MSESRLAYNIARYRKRKGLSQEKVSEYMGVSRQAVTKWETDLSRPSSDHLIRLAELLGVSVDTLLGADSQEAFSGKSGNVEESVSCFGQEPVQEGTDPGISRLGYKADMGKVSWILVGVSVSCILTYMVNSLIWGIFSGGVLICMFLICVPIQMFLHVIFSNALKNDSFSGIAGFDEKTEYNLCEVKKLLVQMDLQIGILSAVFVFLLCVVNCMKFEAGWLNGLLVLLYAMNFTATVEFGNYKGIDRIYCREEDKERARRSMPVTAVYTVVVMAGVLITYVIFETRGIENNTWPAIKAGGILLSGILAATAGFLLEHSRIRKWDPVNTGYRTGRISLLCLMICVTLYAAAAWRFT